MKIRKMFGWALVAPAVWILLSFIMKMQLFTSGKIGSFLGGPIFGTSWLFLVQTYVTFIFTWYLLDMWMTGQ